MAATMTAALFTQTGAPAHLAELPRPGPGPLDVVVKVEACGICLSDVHLFDGGIAPVKQPVVPGHEAAGVVAEVGELVSGWATGDRVVISGGRNCGRCEHCTRGRPDACLQFEIMGFHYDGAWAEYVVVPAHVLSPVPDGVPVEQAAILADAVSTPYSALTERAALRPGESIALWGIVDLGTHAVQIARMVSAGLIVAVDPLPSARARAEALGADVTIDPTGPDAVAQIREATSGKGLDVAVDLVGSNAVMRQAVESLGVRGRAVMVGLSLEPLQLGPGILLGVQSQSILGHLGYEKRHLDELVGLLALKRIDLAGSISDIIRLDQINAGIDRLARKIGDPVRLIVKP